MYAIGVYMVMTWHSIVMAAPFQRFAAAELLEEELDQLLDSLMRNPKQGQIIQGTGGCRKVRVATGGRGKSGGARVITYYHDQDTPLVLLTGYPKSEKDNLTNDERNALKAAIAGLKESVRKNRRK